MNNVELSWASLGITFNTSYNEEVSPEEAIIITIKSGEFPKDRKLFSLMLLWVEKYHKYIHVERLKNMAKSLNVLELSLLGGIC